MGPQSLLEFAAGSDHFFALLATDNGKGVARMVAAYPEMFGRKIIDRVVIYPPAEDPFPRNSTCREWPFPGREHSSGKGVQSFHRLRPNVVYL